MYPILIVLGMLQTGHDTVVARAKQVATVFRDTTAARTRGYGPLIVGRMVDLTPFQGQHWVHRWHLVADSLDFAAPSFVMFAPVEGTWRPAGLAYTRRLSPGAPIPGTLAGAETPWHLHQPCIVVPREGVALADGEADCRARGGAPRPPQLAMVHAWTVPNPEGPFAHDNVALPYWVTGVKPPQPADLATPRRARQTRALGLALGESYGALMPYARLAEHASTMPGLADSLAVHRAVLRTLVPRLRRAEQTGDRAGRTQVVKAMIREWELLRLLYGAAAPSPAIKTQLDRQHARALGETPGHHMH